MNPNQQNSVASNAVNLDQQNKVKTFILKYWYILLLPIIYYIYTNHIQLKITKIEIYSVAQDSIFSTEELLNFKISVITNGKNGQIKLMVFDSEKNDSVNMPSYKLEIDGQNDTSIVTAKRAFTDGQHELRVQYSIEATRFERFCSELFAGKIPTLIETINGEDGSFSFVCLPNEWGDNFANDYILFTDLRSKSTKEIKGEKKSNASVFYIMRNEVYSSHYEIWAKENGIDFYESNLVPSIPIGTTFPLLYPALKMNWINAEKFCTGVGGRLPTDKEWESVTYSQSSSNRSDFSLRDNSSTDRIVPTNQLGIDKNGTFGINSNAVEWCFNKNPENSNQRLLAGWGSFDSKPKKKVFKNMHDLYDNVGFRCVIPKDSLFVNVERFIKKQKND